jgi:hypothetical protein
MPDRQLRITRDTVELGTLPEPEARELLELGLLKPGDLFTYEGMADPKPLLELGATSPPKSRRSWLSAARDSVTGAAAVAASSAGNVAGKLKSLVTKPSAALSGATTRLLDGYTGQIKSILTGLRDSRPMQSVRSGVRDDETMQKVFGAAYDCLPRPVCRFVSEERFMAYCMQHRSRLLDLPEAKSPDASQ